MKKIIQYASTIALAIISLQAAAQKSSTEDKIERNPLDNLIVRTAVKQSLFPEERVYLHFDNSAYYLGESMWFKAYVMSGTEDTPTDMSRVLYVELVAPEGYVVRTNKYKIDEDGTCCGMFELNKLLLSGYYEVRAYTRYMLNRGKEAIFSRVFPVFDKVHADNYDFKNMLDRRRGFLIDIEQDSTRKGLEREVAWINSQQPKADLKFFPEGGHLVDGIECRVAFEVFGADGINSSRSITLLADDDELLCATPSHMGMGTFTFTPKADVKYTAIMLDGKKKRRFNLPEVEDEGAVIRIGETAGNITINVKNNLMLETEIGCAVLYRGKTLFYESYPSTEKEMTFAVDKNSLNEGVNRVVLFVSDGIPLAERMFFVTHDKTLAEDHKSARLTVTSNGNSIDSIALEPYGKISLSIEREDGKPIENGSFSISVSDADNRQQTSYSYNIYTYMLLGSEVKGYIPDAARYFDTANANRAAELDLIMLTHGWTSYDWNKLSRKDARLEQPIEKGIMVKGRYVKKIPNRKTGYLDKMIVTNRPNTEVNFNITYSDSILTMYDFTTDANGEFRILTNDFFGKRVAKLVPTLSTYNSPRDSLFAFVLDRYFSPEMRLYHYWERNVGHAMTAEELKGHNEEMIKINPFEYLLTNLEVISKRKKDAFYRPPRSELRLDFLDEWEYAQDVTYLNRKATWRPTTYGSSWVATEPRWSYPSAFDDNPGLSSFDRYVMGNSGYFGSDATVPDPTGVRSSGISPMVISDPAFNHTLSAYDILRSAFWRHNFNWCYWIQSIVVDGEYSSDSVPAIDHDYLKGIKPIDMTNFKEIVIRSDENTRKRHLLWEYKERTQTANGILTRGSRQKKRGNYSYSSFYDSFTTKTSIDPRNGSIDNAPDAIQFQNYVSDGLHRMDNNSIPNYVACFIPNKDEDATKGIIPMLSHYTTARYTMVYGYTESKEFYAPDYSTMRPDSTTHDYRRTLLWTADAGITDEGRIEVELYNSAQTKKIAVDIEGYAAGTFYANNGSINTREAEKSTFSEIKRKDVTPIIGIHTPELLTHCFRLTEDGRTRYMQKDYDKAFELFNEAAALGYSPAIYNTAVCYLDGKGVEKDSVEAFRHFRKAANMGESKALHNLASCYMHGVGTEKNDSLAVHYYTMSANNGTAISQAILGHMYMNGTGVGQDSIKGREWYSKAADQDEPAALYALASIMEKEDSVAGYSKRQLRKRQTIKFLTRAAEKRHPEAQYKLGRCYESGVYVRKSKKKAFNWYMHAASQGHTDAMERVGYCYEKGRGVKKNEPHAAKWYNLAQQGGNKRAKKKMEWYNQLHFFEE